MTFNKKRTLHINSSIFQTDFFGTIIQKAVAPHDSVVIYIIATPPMSKGEPMIKIGDF